MASVAEFLASVSPTDLLVEAGPVKIYRLELVDGSSVAAAVLDPAAAPDARQALVRGTSIVAELLAPFGFVKIMGIDPDGKGCLFRPVPTGSARDLRALHWHLARRLELFRTTAEAVQYLHTAGHVHGTITPDHVLIDDELSPMLLGPGVMEVRHGDYVAPEVVAGREATFRSDIYSLGRFLQFVVMQEDPSQEKGPPLALQSMAKAPAGLTRIIRKCISNEPEKRYASIPDVLTEVTKYGHYQEVGTEHPDAKEENFSGLSQAPRPTREQIETSKAGSPKKKAEARTSQNLSKKALATEVAQPGNKVRKQQIALGVLGVLCLVIFGFYEIPSILGSRAHEALKTTEGAERKAAIANVMKLDRDLSGNDFRKFDFKGMALIGAKLEKCDMREADFTGTDLSYVALKDANLQGAKFEGADMRSSRFLQALGIRLAHCDKATKLPAGWSCVQGTFTSKSTPPVKHKVRQ